MDWTAPLALLRFGDHAVDAEHDLAEKDGDQKHDRALRIRPKARSYSRRPPHDCTYKLNLPAKNQRRSSVGHAKYGRYHGHKEMLIGQSSTQAQGYKDQKHRNSQSNPDGTDCPAQGGPRMIAGFQGSNDNGNNDSEQDSDRPNPHPVT